MAVTDILKRNPTGLARVAHEAATRALANAESRRTKAASDLIDAEAAQAAAATSDTDAMSGALEAATRRLRDAKDLVAAFDDRIIPAAKAGLALAESGLVNAEREASYQAAEAKRKAAATRLVKDYPDLATRYGELLFAVQEADAAIEAANADLPTGRQPLETVEAMVRDHPALPPRIVSESVESVWYHASGDRVVDPSRIRDSVYRYPVGSSVQHLSTDHCRQFRKRVLTTVPGRPGVTGARLADTPLAPLRFPAPADAEPVTEYLSVDRADQDAA